MEIIIFLGFVGICAFALVWATRKPGRETDLQKRKQHSAKKYQSEKLETPRDSLLSHKDEVWQRRRDKAAHGVLKTNAFVPKSVSLGKPEYDGYSRRDRHHVRDRTAEIKDEEHAAGEVSMTAVELKLDKGDAAKTA